MLAKIRTYSNFGSLNPNLTWGFTYDNSIANFRVANFSISGNPEIGNTVAVGENRCQIRIQQPPMSLIFEFYRSANYRVLAFFNKSWVINLANLQKPWVSSENWFYFRILHKKLVQNQCTYTSFGVLKYEKKIKKQKKIVEKCSFFAISPTLMANISRTADPIFNFFFLNAQNLIWNRLYWVKFSISPIVFPKNSKN